jgi:hypothetical protein
MPNDNAGGAGDIQICYWVVMSWGGFLGVGAGGAMGGALGDKRLFAWHQWNMKLLALL